MQNESSGSGEALRIENERLRAQLETRMQLELKVKKLEEIQRSKVQQKRESALEFDLDDEDKRFEQRNINAVEQFDPPGRAKIVFEAKFETAEDWPDWSAFALKLTSLYPRVRPAELVNKVEQSVLLKEARKFVAKNVFVDIEDLVRSTKQFFVSSKEGEATAVFDRFVKFDLVGDIESGKTSAASIQGYLDDVEMLKTYTWDQIAGLNLIKTLETRSPKLHEMVKVMCGTKFEVGNVSRNAISFLENNKTVIEDASAQNVTKQKDGEHDVNAIGGRGPRCYNCQQFGHMGRECPKPDVRRQREHGRGDRRSDKRNTEQSSGHKREYYRKKESRARSPSYSSSSVSPTNWRKRTQNKREDKKKKENRGRKHVNLLESGDETDTGNSGYYS
jgi:hypothetical protein